VKRNEGEFARSTERIRFITATLSFDKLIINELNVTSRFLEYKIVLGFSNLYGCLKKLSSDDSTCNK
jgi:hypothetical protein